MLDSGKIVTVIVMRGRKRKVGEGAGEEGGEQGEGELFFLSLIDQKGRVWEMNKFCIYNIQ